MFKRCALGSRIVVLDRRTGELRTDEAFGEDDQDASIKLLFEYTSSLPHRVNKS